MRTKAVVRARQELWWSLRNHPKLFFSFEEIGRLFCHDHTTILHGRRAHAPRLMDEDLPT